MILGRPQFSVDFDITLIKFSPPATLYRGFTVESNADQIKWKFLIFDTIWFHLTWTERWTRKTLNYDGRKWRFFFFLSNSRYLSKTVVRHMVHHKPVITRGNKYHTPRAFYWKKTDLELTYFQLIYALVRQLTLEGTCSPHSKARPAKDPR